MFAPSMFLLPSCSVYLEVFFWLRKSFEPCSGSPNCEYGDFLTLMRVMYIYFWFSLLSKGHFLRQLAVETSLRNLSSHHYGRKRKQCTCISFLTLMWCVVVCVEIEKDMYKETFDFDMGTVSTILERWWKPGQKRRCGTSQGSLGLSSVNWFCDQILSLIATGFRTSCCQPDGRSAIGSLQFSQAVQMWFRNAITLFCIQLYCM
jgi:hypothetical protein